jgi:hypothetical protein
MLKGYSLFELMLYRNKKTRVLGILYIYFTKLIWRTHGFPIVGHNK